MRGFCYHCGEHALIVDEVYQCCERPRETLAAVANAIETVLNNPEFSGIYQIRNKESGRLYIGQSRNVVSRLLAHRRGIEMGRHIAEMLEDARSYGTGSFAYEIVEAAPVEDLLTREADAIRDCISEGKELYNRALPGDLPPEPSFTEPTKEQRREARLERRALLHWYANRATISLAEARKQVAEGSDRKPRKKRSAEPVALKWGVAKR
jgi:hypothetical protein